MGEPMRAYEAGQELLCRPPSNSSASGTPAARLVPACTFMCLGGSPTRGHTTSPLAWAAGLHVPCRQLTWGLLCMRRHLGLRSSC